MTTEPKKDEGVKPADQHSSADEKKDTNQKPDETGQSNDDGGEQTTVEIEGVKYTQDQLKTMFKKADDFEKSVALKKLLKENGSDKAPDAGESDSKDDDPIKAAAEAGKKAAEDAIAASNAGSLKPNLAEAYGNFVKNNPWAASKVDGIGQHFDPGTTINVQELEAKLEIAAQNAFPTEYAKSIQDKAKSEVLSGGHNVGAGDIGGGSSEQGGEPAKGKKVEISGKEANMLNAFGVDSENLTEDQVKKVGK